MKILCSIFFLFLSFSACYGQGQSDFMVRTGFMIVMASKSYDAALSKAEEASDLLELELKLRGNYPSEKGGLSNDEVCGCGNQHGYVARGRYDSGMYVSIEYTDDFENFTDGYFIVIVGSGQQEELRNYLPVVKKRYPTAYIKNSDVYIGCMH